MKQREWFSCNHCERYARWYVWYVGCGGFYVYLCDGCLAKAITDEGAWPVVSAKLMDSHRLPDDDRSRLPWGKGWDAAQAAKKGGKS